MSLDNVVRSAKEHPAITAVAVVIIGWGLLHVLGLLGGNNSASNSANASGAAAYYQAQAQQAQLSAAVQVAQIQANSSTAQVGLVTAAKTYINDSNNATTLGLASGQNALASQALTTQWHISDNTINYDNAILTYIGANNGAHNDSAGALASSAQAASLFAAPH